MRISVVTPTHGRPEAVALCRRWFETQTLAPIEHIVVDESDRQGGAGQCDNLVAGLAKVSPNAEVIVFADDDDHYGPGWLAWLAHAFADPQVLAAGQIVTRMFHWHASAWLRCNVGPLPGTMAFRADEAPTIGRLIATEGTPKRLFRGKLPATAALCTEHQHVTHLKGLYPLGMSAKHQPAKFTTPDPGRRMLVEHIGEDAVEHFLLAYQAIRGAAA